MSIIRTLSELTDTLKSQGKVYPEVIGYSKELDKLFEKVGRMLWNGRFDMITIGKRTFFWVREKECSPLYLVDIDGAIDYIASSCKSRHVSDCCNYSTILPMARALGVDDKLIAKAKALCVDTVRHFISDKRCAKALDATFLYVAGKISREELNKYADAAFKGLFRVEYIKNEMDKYVYLLPDDSEKNYENLSVYEKCTIYYFARVNDYANWAAYRAAKEYVIDDTAPAYDAITVAAYAAYCIAYCLCKTKAEAEADYDAAKEASTLQIINICRDVLTDAIVEKLKYIKMRNMNKKRHKF
jgi:hypothetical protein